jgi:hypothetical protein
VLGACLIGAPAGAAIAPAPTVPAPTAAPTPADQSVKAAYLTKFAPFVVWPPAAFAGGPTAPLVLCVQGDDPFGATLDRLAEGQRIGDRPLLVRRVARIDADSGCQIAYLGGSPAQSSDAALKAVEGRPVLTVTDADGAGSARGIVHLILADGRVRFAIDSGKAAQCGLTISSKLLALASEVKR